MSILALVLACAGCAPVPDAVPIEAVCSVTDGDTIRCGDERIRLLGIDAPELPGHCRQGRVCVPGDGHASTRELRRAVSGGELSISRIGEDRYGRTLGVVYAGSANLSCHQVQQGQAVYVPKWDNKGAVRADCPDVAAPQ